jgi:hypothetical protein
LLHGYPNNHVLWRGRSKAGAALSRRVSGSQGLCFPLPEPGEKLINYSHRVMAEDMIEVMERSPSAILSDQPRPRRRVFIA